MRKTNESKLLPRLRFPEFRNEEGWEMKKVGEVIEESKVPSTSNNPHNRITVRLNQKGVEKREVRGTEADNATYFFIRRKGQFIYGKQNLHKGAFGLIPDELDGFESSQDIPAFDFKNGYYPQYFVYYLGQENVYPDLEKISTGTGSKRIHPRDLFQVKFPFPKTEEQQKIAACLSSLDDVITAESKKLEVLKEHKKGLLQNLFPQQGETVLKFRFEEFQDSDAWQEDTLLNIASFRRGSFPQPYGLSEWYDDEKGMPFIQVFDVDDNFRLKPATKNKISELAAKQSVFIPKGTLIITLQGSIGRVAITQYDAYIDRTILLFEEFHQEIDITFFAYSLFLLFEIEKQKAPGGIIKTITKEVLSNFVVKLPSIEEQRKISSCLSSLDELINAQSQKIETLKLHKKGLLQGLFPDINEHNG